MMSSTQPIDGDHRHFNAVRAYISSHDVRQLLRKAALPPEAGFSLEICCKVDLERIKLYCPAAYAAI